MRKFVYVLTGPFIVVGVVLGAAIGIPLVGVLAGINIFFEYMDKGD